MASMKYVDGLGAGMRGEPALDSHPDYMRGWREGQSLRKNPPKLGKQRKPKSRSYRYNPED